jgi:hypothetical protein
MEAVSRGWDLSLRRAVALYLSFVAIALLAGGAGGYLIEVATTHVVTQTVDRVVIVPAEPTPFLRTTAGYIPGL